MGLISRDSVRDAQELFENLIPNEKLRIQLITFIADSVKYANQLEPHNWNLNVDKQGNFIRFNTGRVYCINISKQRILILGLRHDLQIIFDKKPSSVKFQGFKGEEKIISDNLSDTPDCLVSVPNSIGVLLNHEKISTHLDLLKKANINFIKYAVKNTTIVRGMKNAHSVGGIKYFEMITTQKIKNPLYNLTIEEYDDLKAKNEKRAAELEKHILFNIVRDKISEPSKINVLSKKFVRDPYISEYVKRKANGICQDCGNPAPFNNKITGNPFLETHHIIPLSEGGEDSVENTIALCPNCHRKRHYG